MKKILCAALFVIPLILGWYAWNWFQTPRLPPIKLPNQPDPALTAAVEKACARVRQNPRAAADWGHLGRLLLVNGVYRSGIACLAQAERLEPAEPLWPYYQGYGYLQEEPEQAIPCFQRALAGFSAQPGDRGAALTKIARLRLAQTLLSWNRFALAEVEYAQLARDDPDNPLVHWGLASIELGRRDLDAARKHLLRIENNPLTRKKACSQQAQIYQQLNQPDKAREYQDRARRLPLDGAWFDPLLRDNDQLVVGRESRLFLAEKLGQQGHLADAIRVLNQVLVDFPDEARALVKLGMFLNRQKDYRAAQQVLEAALAHAGDKVQAHFFLSVALFHQGEALESGSPQLAVAKFQDAARHAQAAVDLQAGHPLAYIYLGLSLEHLGKKAEAIMALRHAVDCGQESVDTHYHLGRVLAKYGQRDEARKHLENSLRLATPDDFRAKLELDRLAK